MEEIKKEPIHVFKLNLEKQNVRCYNETIQKNFDWVKYGSNNDYPEHLSNLLYNSATHLGICTRKKEMIKGDGFIVNKTTNKNELKTFAYLEKVNRYGETMEDIFDRISFDYVVYGMAAIQIIWGRSGQYIAEMFHFPVNKLRIGRKDERGMINSYFWSDDWKNYRKDEYEPKSIPAFTDNLDIIKQAPTQIMLIKQASPGLSYYSLPSYVGALNYIDLDYQISEFANSYIKNGMFPSMVINYKNVPTYEDKQTIADNIQDQYTGTMNAAKVILSFTEGTDSPDIITCQPNDVSNIINTLTDLSVNKVLQAHQINPILAGISVAGSLGDGQEINNAFLLYESSVVDPMRKTLLSGINKIMRINNLDKLEVVSNAPIPFTADQSLMTKVLKINEVRKELGYDEIDETNYKDIIDNIVTNPVPTVVTPQPITKNNKTK